MNAIQQWAPGGILDLSGARNSLARCYMEVRKTTESICRPLSAEDQMVQSMPDASPAKWHQAHTTWFFETFLLIPYLRDYQPFHPDFQYVFNSYYKGLGAHPNRAYRGLFSRPPLEQVQSYRAHVDQHMMELLESGDLAEFGDAVQLGLNHEQQHQELILTDIKHAFWSQPLRPAYAQPTPSPETRERGVSWFGFDAGLYKIGYEGDAFAFDNERPRHQAYLNEFQIASRLVTNAEYMAFMNDDGYLRPELWLSDGWDTMNAQGWRAPLYWEHQGDEWMTFTAAGMQKVKSARTSESCELLRGRCIRAVGESATRNGNGVGSGGGECSDGRQFSGGRISASNSRAGERGRATADVWRCMGVDGESVCWLSGIRAEYRRVGRI